MKSKTVLVSPDRNDDWRRRAMTLNDKLWHLVFFISVSEFLVSMYTLDAVAMVASMFIFIIATYSILEL